MNDIGGEMVYESFGKTAQSTGAMDGCQPKELAYFSMERCERVAAMLNQIEEGAPWPTSTRHARDVYLGKEGAAVGEVVFGKIFLRALPVWRGGHARVPPQAKHNHSCCRIHFRAAFLDYAGMVLAC